MIFKNITEVIGWCNTIIPTIFDDSLSYLEMVAKLKCVVNDVIKAMNELGTNVVAQNNDIKILKNKIEELNKKIEEFEKGYTIGDGVIELRMIAEDTLKYFESIIAKKVYESAKFVTFGLTDDGYFCAYIPESWEDVEFDTSENGELILRL